MTPSIGASSFNQAGSVAAGLGAGAGVDAGVGAELDLSPDKSHLLLRLSSAGFELDEDDPVPNNWLKL